MFVKTGKKEAEEMLTWCYEGQYSYYNMVQEEKYYLYNTNYHNSFDDKGVEGFFCTEYEATIDIVGGFQYSGDYLDIGFGLRPDLCGKGLGGDYIRSIMKYLNLLRGARKFRLTVVGFNKRAVSLYEKIGFKVQDRVISSHDGKEFIIMVFNMDE